MELAQEIGDRNFEFEARQSIGRLQHAIGNAAEALAHHRQALALATELRQPADQARAHDGLAHAHDALAQPEPARHHWQTALDIVTGLGTDHIEDEHFNTSAIRARLASSGEGYFQTR